MRNEDYDDDVGDECTHTCEIMKQDKNKCTIALYRRPVYFSLLPVPVGLPCRTLHGLGAVAAADNRSDMSFYG